MRWTFFCAFVIATSSTFTTADDWPHWRGLGRNSVVAELSGWNTGSWTLEDSWDASVGEGSSSPLIVAGRVYTMGWRSGQDHIGCLDAETGETIWSVSYKCPKYGRLATGDQGLYSGPSSTPEFDLQTGLLYTLSTDGDLNCWDTRQRGKKIWSTNLYEKYHAPRRPRVGRSGLRDYGYSSSPLVYGDLLIVEVGARNGNLMAFDKRSGARRWASQSKSPAGHNGGPTPITVEGISCVAVHNHDGLLVVRMDKGHEGESVASYEWVTSFANNIASATVYKNYVLLTSSYNQQRIAKFEITLRGAKKLWEQKHASKVCSPVVYDGRVYWAWRQVMCLDFETGELQWKGGRVGDAGSVIATKDGRLIVWANRGDLLLVESAGRSPNKYTELATRKRILGRSDAWPHIVLADNRLYCKDRNGSLRCFKIAH
jgi:outer membrane protein assembly factor BamB